MQAAHLSPVATGPRIHHARAAPGPLRQRYRASAFSAAPRATPDVPCRTPPAELEGAHMRPAEPAPSAALRASVALASAALMLACSTPSALARLELPNKEVDDTTSPFVQELLKRSNENRERYQRERLQDYYRRNFKEYFEFEASSSKVARARGLSTESQEAIAKWLADNK